MHRRDNIYTSCGVTRRGDNYTRVARRHRNTQIGRKYLSEHHRQIDALSFMLERRSDCPFTGAVTEVRGGGGENIGAKIDDAIVSARVSTG